MAKSKRIGIYESVVVMNMDSIPCPDRSYHSAQSYYDPSMPTKRPQLQMSASKGCPFKCVYCSWTQLVYNGKCSYRDPNNIAKEIIECVKEYGYGSIFFDDDTFNIGDDRISKLCDKLYDIGLPWTMMGRLDTSPFWLIDKMIKSGCVGMRFGIESMDDVVLAAINKGIDRKTILKNLVYISNTYPDLMIHVMLMKNLPKQTNESHLQDIELLNSLGFSTTQGHRCYQISSCSPFPGTKLYHDLQSHGVKVDDFKQYDGNYNTVKI